MFFIQIWNKTETKKQMNNAIKKKDKYTKMYECLNIQRWNVVG